MSTTTIVIIVVAIVLLAALFAVVGMAIWRRRERRDLQERFGPEYERLERERDADAAVGELRHREERHEQFDIRDLTAERREDFRRQWHEVQREFVDHPSVAVARGDALIQDVMHERGYPVTDFEQRAADLSVDHPEVVQHYREGHALAGRNRAGDTSTEELRAGFVHYRELFARLLGEGADDPPADHGGDRHAVGDRTDSRRDADQ